jgi:putative transposase
MRSKVFAQVITDVGVTKPNSRPQVSDDSPFSESQFKTLKCRPGFPDRLERMDDASPSYRGFVGWYSHDHRHNGIALLTRARFKVQAAAVLAEHQRVLSAAFIANPARFGCPPTVPELARAVWIDQPSHIS